MVKQVDFVKDHPLNCVKSTCLNFLSFENYLWSDLLHSKYFCKKLGSAPFISRLGSVSNVGTKISQNQLSLVVMPGLTLLEHCN